MSAGGYRIAVFETDGGLRAVENACAHVGNPIDDGAVSGEVLSCPWHGWRYDLRTGQLLTAFGRRRGLRCFPVRLSGDAIQVDVDVDVDVGGEAGGEGRGPVVADVDPES